MNRDTRAVLVLLDRYMKAHGITSDRQLAKHLGISNAYLSYIRGGQRNVGGKMLRAIMANCEELVLPLAAIMGKGGASR